jgi:hypothetical protein
VSGVKGECSLNECDTALDDDINWESEMCSNAYTFYYDVPETSKTLTIQLHDNFFNGDKDCGNNDEGCCGGGYSACGTDSGVCEVTIDLDDCIQEPSCYNDEDCSYLNDDCVYGECAAGKCQQIFKNSNSQCRAANGLCDQPEYCTGNDAGCPSDSLATKGTVCREAVHACDYAETCSGVSADCPRDAYKEQGEICREKTGPCDYTEVCTGNSPTCPDDKRRDFGYTYKCSTTQFLCGIDRSELIPTSGNSFKVGSGENSCGIGTANAYVDLPYPACLGYCLYDICPNNRGLSNWSESHCDSYTGKWACDYKENVGSGTKLPYCFNWED